MIPLKGRKRHSNEIWRPIFCRIMNIMLTIGLTFFINNTKLFKIEHILTVWQRMSAKITEGRGCLGGVVPLNILTKFR